jgi:hypothetical protein
MFYVTKVGRRNLTLFLANRAIVKDKWWVTDTTLAMTFEKESAAKIQAGKLKYGVIRVVSSETAKRIASDNMYDEVIDSIDDVRESDGDYGFHE